jgi:hypothetical protein
MRTCVLFSVSTQPFGQFGVVSAFHLLTQWFSLLWPHLSLSSATWILLLLCLNHGIGFMLVRCKIARFVDDDLIFSNVD